MNRYSPPDADVINTNADVEVAKRESGAGIVLFVVGLSGALILAGVATAVIPQFRELFKGFGADLPVATQLVVDYYLYLWFSPLMVVAVRFAWPVKRVRSIAACFFGLALLVLGVPLLVLAMYLPIFRLGSVV